jgi:transcription initiation factor IIE alpha subunit
LKGGDAVVEGTREAKILSALQEIGCCDARTLVALTGLDIYKVNDALYRLREKGKVKTFLISSSRSGRIRQTELFGKRIGKYLYYTERSALLQYLKSHLRIVRPHRSLGGYHKLLRNRGLTKQEIQSLLRREERP